MKNNNQLDLEGIESNSSWLKQVNTIDVDDFVGYNQTIDQQRYVAFDFVNKTAYVASHDLLEDNNVTFEDFKKEFSGLNCIKQKTDDMSLDPEHNRRAVESAQKSYIAGQLNKNSDGVKKNQKDAENEVENVQDNTLAPRTNLKMR